MVNCKAVQYLKSLFKVSKKCYIANCLLKPHLEPVKRSHIDVFLEDN